MRVCGCVCVRTYARLRIWKWITRKMDPTTSSNKPTPTPLNSPNFTHSHTQNWTGHAFVVRPNVFKEDHAGYMEEVFRINWTIRQERPHSSNHSQELRPQKKANQVKHWVPTPQLFAESRGHHSQALGQRGNYARMWPHTLRLRPCALFSADSANRLSRVCLNFFGLCSATRECAIVKRGHTQFEGQRGNRPHIPPQLRIHACPQYKRRERCRESRSAGIIGNMHMLWPFLCLDAIGMDGWMNFGKDTAHNTHSHTQFAQDFGFGFGYGNCTLSHTMDLDLDGSILWYDYLFLFYVICNMFFL